MKSILYILLFLLVIYSYSIKDITSSALDFVPVVDNLKSIGEAATG